MEQDLDPKVLELVRVLSVNLKTKYGDDVTIGVEGIGSEADTVLMVGPTLYIARSQALTVHSGYFRAMFNGEFTESRSSSVDVDLPEPGHFKDLFSFLISEDAGPFILPAADRDVVPALLNASFLDCPVYVTALLSDVLSQAKFDLLLDERLDNFSLLYSESMAQLRQHFGRAPRPVLTVLAHLSRSRQAQDVF